MKFSIIIPNYNSEKWIEKCINSVLNQTYKNFEIIVVDDISTDNSVSIIKSLLRKKDMLILNTTKRLNGGTRNEGIRYATGDYIINIDSDDWLIDNQVLENIKKHIEDNNYPDIVFTGFKMLSNDGESINILKINNEYDLYHNGFAAAWLKVVKKAIYLKCPFPEGTLYEDRIQNLSMIIKCDPTYTSLGMPTHCWNRYNENATTFNPKWCWYRFEYAGVLYRLLKENPDCKYRDELINELHSYQNSLNEMVNEL